MLARQTLIKLGRYLAQHRNELSDTDMPLSRRFTKRRVLDTGLAGFKSDQEVFHAYLALVTELRNKEVVDNVWEV